MRELLARVQSAASAAVGRTQLGGAALVRSVGIPSALASAATVPHEPLAPQAQKLADAKRRLAQQRGRMRENGNIMSP
jgi:hypothetical protein